MVNQKNLLSLAIVSAVFFIALSFLVNSQILRKFDFDATVRIQDNLPDNLITFFSTFSIAGTVEFISLILLGIMFVFPILRRFSLIFLYLMTGFIEVIGKSLIEQAGPPIYFLKTNLSVNFPSHYIPHEFFAYPSGHSARTAFVCAVLIFAILISRKFHSSMKTILVLSAIFLALIMFVSRVYLGEHWTTDVIGGALLGFSLAMIASARIVKRTIT
jgi:undecaprenyl-diphosphatase